MTYLRHAQRRGGCSGRPETLKRGSGVGGQVVGCSLTQARQAQVQAGAAAVLCYLDSWLAT